MGRSNLSGALAVDWPQDRRTLRTHPTRRPREDVFSAEAEPVISFCNFPAFFATGSGSHRNGGAVLAPAELATIDPHPMQNDSQASRDRDNRSTHPAPLDHPHAPRLQPRPFTAVGEQYLCGLVEHRAQQSVTAFGHPAVIVDLAGLVALRGQADMCTDRPGMDEALRLMTAPGVGEAAT